MKRSLFDLHCDTALDLYTKGVSLASNDLHIDLEKANRYTPYTQICAIWSESKKGDEECYHQFLAAAENLKKEVERNKSIVSLCKSYNEVKEAADAKKHAFILAVEDARLLSEELSRLDVLHSMGVRFLTLTWGGETCIGGSFDTDLPLTDFGRSVLCRCFNIGIIPDISHSSEFVADEVADMARRRELPFVATHSNSYSVYPHRRNLRDRHIDAINELGGLIGISLCPKHLTDTDEKICDVTDIIRHIDYYMSRGCKDTLALGCDLDGTVLPFGFDGLQDIYKIAEALAKENYSDALIDKIFYNNANNFIKNNLK